MTCPLCDAGFERSSSVRWRKDGFDIVACPSCGLLFRADLPTLDELAEIYGIDYFKAGAEGGGEGYLDYVADADVHRLAAQRRLALLARHVDAGALLDVGAAAGFFVAEARSQGWDARGIDVADSMLEWGRRELAAPLEHTTLAHLDAEPGSFAALTMWDYIEHALDPVADVARAAEIVRPGGVIALSTGDASALFARVSGERWHLLTPHHHNFYFTPPTLRRLLERHGFEVVSMSHRGSRYPLRYLVHKARTVVHFQALDRVTARLADSALGALPVPMNLWDIVTVVARRR